MLVEFLLAYSIAITEVFKRIFNLKNNYFPSLPSSQVPIIKTKGEWSEEELKIQMNSVTKTAMEFLRTGLFYPIFLF